MPTPQMFYSPNQWPAGAVPQDLGVKRFALNLVKGVNSIDLHPEVASPLVEMIKWWDANIEPVKVIHGYSWRAIAGKAGTGKLSNHASGTAIDINPDAHPIESAAGTGLSAEGKKAVGTIPASKLPGLLAKAKQLGLRWGGSYAGRKDEMHFEYIGAAPAVAVTNSSFALTNTHYVPPRFNVWYKNPWFYALAGVTLTALIVTPIAIARSRK